MTITSPCKDCELRHAGCHADCPNYGAWKAEQEAEREKKFRKRETDYQVNDLILTNMQKVVKAKRRLSSAKKK